MGAIITSHPRVGPVYGPFGNLCLGLLVLPLLMHLQYSTLCPAVPGYLQLRKPFRAWIN